MGAGPDMKEALKKAQERYFQWLNKKDLEPSLRAELQAVGDSTVGIVDRFYKELDFGTAGLRGIIGAGTNRMNIYTVRKATQGLANYLHKVCNGPKAVVIAYDTRYMSREFALESALTLARNRIKACLFSDIAPTPLLSYAVGYLQATAGIVITASHNPKEYNGYKVYWQHGGQIVDELARDITEEINLVGDELDLPTCCREKAEQAGLLIWLGNEINNSYLEKVKQLILRPGSIRQAADSLKIVYTPLHGTGGQPVLDLLTAAGFKNIFPVKEQLSPDPSFSTVECPNPEEPAAYRLALKLAGQVSADIIICSDPDADRLGVMAKDSNNGYKLITGNQLGALLVDYILSSRKESGILPADGVIIKTIVTSTMGSDLAARYGIKTIDVLTGFKYIGEKIAQFEREKSPTFLFGYEESFGFLAGDFVRDKDAVQISLLVCEMAAYYQNMNKTLLQRLEELYQELGYYQEELINIHMAGIKGQQKTSRILNYWRESSPSEISGLPVYSVADYQACFIRKIPANTVEETTLPRCNVLHYTLADGSWFCIRPSGTEPKLKIYFGVKDVSPAAASAKLSNLREAVLAKVKEIE